MDIRLVALDLDDTLLDSKCCVSPRAKRAIQRVMDKGVIVTLATGRMYSSARPYALDMGLDVPLITYQGALVKTSMSEEVLYHRPVPQNLAKELIMEAQSHEIPVQIYVNDKLYVSRITWEIEEYIGMSRVPVTEVGDLIGFLDQDPTKVLFINEEEVLNKLWVKMEQKYNNTLYITKSKPEFLEFTNPQATKGLGLLAVAEHLGIARENIMAMGDSFNDLELLKTAGFAVAMGNAREELKREADYVTGTNNDDGVAEALEKFILG